MSDEIPRDAVSAQNPPSELGRALQQHQSIDLAAHLESVTAMQCP